MARQEAENSKAFSIFWLKKNGYLSKGGGWSSGSIKWTYGLSGNESSIGFDVNTNSQDITGEGDHIRLHYTHTSSYSDEKSDMDYKIPLTTTQCHYGGIRYWFICPLSKNDVYCGRRVGVLYCIGKYWGCRYCGEIAYQAQFEGGSFRVGSLTEPDVEKAYNEIKREYYNGKPTRRYKRYLRLRRKMDNNWLRAGMKFGMKF